MNYALSIFMFLLGLKAQADCHLVTALTLSPDLTTAYGVPKIGYGPYYEGYSWNTLTSEVTGKFDGVGWPGAYSTTQFLKTSRDGKHIIGIARNYLIVWEIESQKQILTKRLPSSSGIGYVEMAGDIVILARTKVDSERIEDFTAINVKSGETVYILDNPPGSFFYMDYVKIAISEDGNLFYITYMENSPAIKKILSRINILNGEKLDLEITGNTPNLFVSDGRLYLYNLEELNFDSRWLQIFNANTLEFIEEYEYPKTKYERSSARSQTLQVLPKNNIAKLGNKVVVDLKTGKKLFKFPEETEALDSFLSPDGKTFGVVNSKYVYLYDTSTWKLKGRTCISESNIK